MPTKKPRAINVKPTATKTAKAAVAKLATAAREAVKPVAKPDAAATPAIAKPIRGVTRTAQTIVANATNFGNLSDRDTSYISFYAGLAKRNGGSVTLDSLATLSRNPHYSGSAKAHDAGVIVRLTKAGLITPTPDGRAFSFTKQAETHSAYSKA